MDEATMEQLITRVLERPDLCFVLEYFDQQLTVARAEIKQLRTRAARAEAEAADLRQRLERVTALVPADEWLEMMNGANYNEVDCRDCPFDDENKCNGQCRELGDVVRTFAAVVRDWRATSNGREEEEEER